MSEILDCSKAKKLEIDINIPSPVSTTSVDIFSSNAQDPFAFDLKRLSFGTNAFELYRRNGQIKGLAPFSDES